MGALRSEGHRISLQDHEDVVKLIVVIEVQLYEYTNSYCILQLKRAHCMIYELYPSQAV